MAAMMSFMEMLPINLPLLLTGRGLVLAVEPGDGDENSCQPGFFCCLKLFLPPAFKEAVAGVENSGMNVQLIRKNPWFRRALWATVGVLLLWVLSWLALPRLLKHQLATLGSAQLGRAVTMGSVEFKPWSLELTIRDLAVARLNAAPQDAPQFSLQRLYIDAELQSLWRLAPVLDAVQLDSAHLQLTYLGGGHYDVDDILARLQAASAVKADQPATSPQRFALYNLVLADGRVDMQDQPLGKTHELRDLAIQLPFLSTLASQRSVLVQPQLAFVLNGSRFESSAEGTPFAESPQMNARFKVSALDLAPYLAYAPASLPVKLASAVLNADVNVSFQQLPETVVKLSGTVQADKVRLFSRGGRKGQGADGADLLAFDRLSLSLADVRPLAQVIHLSQVELEAPRLSVRRSANGQLNLANLTGASDTPEKIATRPYAERARGQNEPQVEGWRVQVDQLVLHRGALQWTDESLAVPAQLGLRELTLSARDIAWPTTQPVPFEGATRLGTQGDARLTFKGSATQASAQVSVIAADVPLALAAPYLAPLIAPTVSGTLHADVDVNWAANTAIASKRLTQGQGNSAGQLQLLARTLRLDEVVLTQKQTRLASFKQLKITQADLDLLRQSARVGQLSLSQPQVTLARSNDGRWMFESWLHAAPGPRASAAPAKATASPPWALTLNDVQMSGGKLGFEDAATARAVVFDLAALSLQLQHVSTVGGKPFSVRLASQLRAKDAPQGRLSWEGQVGLTPLSAQGQVQLHKLPVQVFEPYLGDAFNLTLLRADASFVGSMNYRSQPGGPSLILSGDTVIDDLRAHSLPGANGASGLAFGEELLNWKSLNLRGVALALAPGTATRVSVKETALSDFYARVILDASGRLNLQDLLKPTPMPVAAAPLVTSNASDLIAVSPELVRARALNDAQAVMAPVIEFGPISVLGGRVDFSDRFIQPNYSAHLTELAGTLSAFSSQTPDGGGQLADLSLRGRAEGTASLEITGKLNPLVTPLALDIKGRVRDLELPPLSPYAVRYAGHGIERGKLSMDVGYQLQPNGQLTASNNIILKQLDFGEPVEGAPASLPVKLAVALLADRQGVIDLNLPITGSINDPEFRFGAVVFKIIGNLLAKVVTAPFSLLANAFGGGEEMSQVSFTPGSAVLTPEGRAGLDKVAQALLERPALTLTVTGAASLAAEREALKREQLNALLRAEQQRASPQASSSDDPRWLKAVYKRATFPKPRNVLGLSKDLSAPEMTTLLLANLSVTPEQARDLATQRGVAVRDYLETQQLPLDRLFLGAPRLGTEDAPAPPVAALSLALP